MRECSRQECRSPACVWYWLILARSPPGSALQVPTDAQGVWWRTSKCSANAVRKTCNFCQLQLQGEDESHLLTLSLMAVWLLEGCKQEFLQSAASPTLFPAAPFWGSLRWKTIFYQFARTDPWTSTCSLLPWYFSCTGYFASNTSYGLSGSAAFHLLARASS